MIEALNQTGLPPLMASLPQWTPNAARGSIEREFIFVDFLTAIEFMKIVALIAHEADHHPEWSNVYNRVHILLTTHDAGDLSKRDVTMAKTIDEICAELLEARIDEME